MANYENIRPYAEFSHEAAQHGGVDSYLSELQEASYDNGVADTKASMPPYLFIAAVAGGAVVTAGRWVYRKAKSHYLMRKEQNNHRIEMAKKSIKSVTPESENGTILEVSNSQDESSFDTSAEV